MGTGSNIVESAKERVVSVAGGPALQIIAVLAAASLGVWARKTYLRDVATAAASSRANKS